MDYEETAALLKEHGVDFHLDDVISCKNSDQNAVLIEGYPLVKEVRTRKITKVDFPSSSATKTFCEKVRKSIARPIPPHLLTKELTNRVLLLVNPFSGQKRAPKLWQDYGKTVLEAAEIEVDIINTEYPQHATEIVRSMNIDNYDAILVNSGDGLVTEVTCGLLLRKDRERALKIPICHIPGGTSNALAGAILFSSNEPFLSRDVFITECALFAARPRYMPLRLFSVETEHNDVKSMFLSACWGLIADIDLGSERFRWAGLARLHIEAIIRILQLPQTAKYRGRISYISVNNDDLVRKTRIGHLADRSLFGKDHFNSPPVPQATGKESQLSVDFKNISDALDKPYLKVPSLNEPLGKEWTVIEGEFVMVNVTSLSHLGSDLPYIPSTQMGEPILYLTMIDWAILKNRFEVADLFIRMNRGVHLTYPCFQIIPVRAVRVEPLTKTGYFAIDGEPCQSGSAFQVVPQNHCATVIGRKPVP